MSRFDRRVDAFRRFSRSYTRAVGALADRYLDGPYPLSETRVLYELATRTETSAAELARELGFDAGQMSRILRRFRQDGLIETERAPDDARRKLLRLTDAGRAVFAPLERASREEHARMLAKLPEPRQAAAVEAMGRIEELLGAGTVSRRIELRPPQPGDFGWVISRHGALYAAEYGWDGSFETLVAGIVAAFMTSHDPARERAWIAAVDGEPAGSVFLVRAEDEVAKLRLLLVEPWARGLGLGARLVDACMGEARRLGYRRMVLWTNDCLSEARRLYVARGFRLTAREPHHSFGVDLVGETWEVEL